MLFNSGVFFQFLAAFLLLYYLVRNRLWARNALLLGAGYLFYGWWDYRFLALLLATSLLDFYVGRGLAVCERPRGRRLLVACSLAGNLGMLGFFKYYNFFVDSFAALAARAGFAVEPRLLNVVLPVGISFYTFQTLSYTLDVYRREVPATRNLLNFLAYVSFFPQLVAGPIERATHLLPQFEQTRTITRPMLAEGVWLAIWGLFKKVVVADNLGPLVDLAYGVRDPGAPLVLLGTLAFAGQIYGDFSGYSDIARGLARLLGFELRLNFNLPYLATSPRDFWRRWHISLSTWLRDYLYRPLGGNRKGPRRTHLNLLLTMLLGGLWHGAAWNFVLWGLWHGAALAIDRALRRGAATPDTSRLRSVLGWIGTLLVVGYGWLLFRAGSVGEVVALTRALAQWHVPVWLPNFALVLAVFSLPLAAVQGWQWRAGDLLVPLRAPAAVRVLLEGALVLAIVTFWRRNGTPFIYFQF
jgi:D-alanyl-lipoteichoic acid acyltransferase DltB (MBOAT superfamily)